MNLIHWRPLILSWAALALSATHPSTANAALIVSNLEEETHIILSSFEFGATDWMGVSFKTGSHTKGYLMSAVDGSFINLEAYPGSTNRPFTASIYPDSNGLPTTNPNESIHRLTGDLPTDIQTNDPQTVSFAASNGGIILAANTDYWLVYSSEGNSEAEIVGFPSRTMSFSDSSADGWTIGDKGAGSGNQGESWTVQDLPAVMQFGIHATPVPEPHQTLIIATVFLIIFLSIRRTRPKVSQSNGAYKPLKRFPSSPMVS